VARHGDELRSLQITNEPNLSFMDGSKPYVIDALVHGVLAAKDEAGRRGVSLDVGFGSVPQSAVALPTFWEDLGAAGGSALVDAVDFVGHNFYVDVFEDEPLQPAAIAVRIEQTVRDLRVRDLPIAGFPATVPIRVTENGWPTGTNPLTGTVRTEARQREVIPVILRTLHGLAAELNITHYMLFGLRDADSAEPDLFHQFGILRDDYTPKPAYATFKSLVAELSR
jgi:exo-beta-1,3-glucanase (GH17 family)